MLNKLSTLDRILVATSLLGFLILSYLLYDDSFFFSKSSSGTLETIGSISTPSDDVKKRSAADFIWAPIDKKESVLQDDTVFTGPDSKAFVSLNDGSELELSPNTLVVLHLGSDKALELDLKYGNLLGEFKSSSEIRIKTNKETVKVQGKKSKVRLQKSFASQTQIKVLQGQVKIKDSKNQEVKVQQNDQVRVLATTGEIRKQKSFTFTPPTNRKIAIWTDGKTEIPLIWDGEGDAQRFRIQLALNSEFNKIEFELLTPEKKFQLKNYPLNRPFYWRVDALDEKDKTLATSETQEVVAAQMTPPEIQKPADRTLLNINRDPSNNLIESPVVTIEWNSITEGPFVLEMSQDSSFKTIFLSQTLVEKSWITPELKAGNYYVRVKSTPATAPSSSWSRPISFGVKIASPDMPLAAPILFSPKQQFKPNDKSLQPKIAWKPVPESQEYEVFVSQFENFTNAQNFVTKKTAIQLTDYKIGTTYYRVRGYKSKDKPGPFSETGQVIVELHPPLLSKLKHATVIGKAWDDPGKSQAIDLKWSQVPLAKAYKVEVSEKPDFAGSIQTYEATKSELTVKIERPGSYYFRVTPKGTNNTELTKPSQTETFTYTLMLPLKTPNHKEPLEGMTYFLQVTDEPYIPLEWENVTEADKYELQVSSDKNFSKPLISQSLANTRFLIKNKISTGTHYWRVRSFKEGKEPSPWSKPSKFLIFSSTGQVEDGQ